jgi:cell division septation protein DedD
VSPVDPAQLGKWAAETEIAAGQGAARKGGKWRVFLMHARSGDDLAEFSAQLAAAGYAARIAQLSDEGKPAYWIYIGNLPDRTEARALADKLRAQFKLGTVSISTQ